MAKNNHLNEVTRNLIIEEIMKDYNFKQPEEFIEEIQILVDKHMTELEKRAVKDIKSLVKMFHIHCRVFNYSLVSMYIANTRNGILIPQRMHDPNSDFGKELKEIGDRADDVYQDIAKLRTIVNSNKTIGQFRKNLPQFTKYLDKVLSGVNTGVPATATDTSFLDKYRKN